ncbi:MAG: YbjN domain-containing protein [Leptolyngbyaceae bacterium]|nr:YbjN domain-containing protein [Leptolyngbyaceae bacterium]
MIQNTTHETSSSNSFSSRDISESVVDIIETVIASLEDNGSAMVSHTNEGYLWRFCYGSVNVFVQLTGTTDEDTLIVWSSVLKLPVQDEARLMRMLLEMNWADTFEARFCILGDEIVISTTRMVADLTAGEISRNITIVATIADEQDDRLAAEFQGE